VKPNTKNAVPALLKEYCRRLALSHQDIEQINPNPKSGYPGLKRRQLTKKELLDALQTLQHPPEDVPYIIGAFVKFTTTIRAHFFKNSKCEEATLQNGLRKVECMLHKDTRDAFIRYKDQLSRQELDALNSSQKPKTFFQQCAELYNKQELVLKSSIFDEIYGEPLHFARDLFCPDKTSTANDFKEFMNFIKRPISLIEKNIGLSGRGEEHYLKKYTTNAHKDEKGNIVAHGDVVGYAFARLEQENILELVTQSLHGNAATMDNIPDIPMNEEADSEAGTGRKRGPYNKRGSSSKKSKNTSPGAKGVALQMLRYMQKTDETQQIHDKKRYLLEKQMFLSTEEARAVTLEEHLQTCNKYVFDIRRELRNEGMSSDDIKQDETFLSALESVDRAKLLQSELKQQIAAAKREIADLKDEVEQLEEDANLAVPTELFDLDDDTTPGPSKAFTRFKSQREFNTEANDGSDEELNADYEIADDIDEGDNSDENEEDND
jgi:hypothetical protein